MEENFPFVLDRRNIFHIEQRFHLEDFQYKFSNFHVVNLYNVRFLFPTRTNDAYRFLFRHYLFTRRRFSGRWGFSSGNLIDLSDSVKFNRS